jgi:ankyrin repeat protein
VRALIAEGGDVNGVAANGWTALHYSAVYGHLEVVKLLIASGSRLDVLSNHEYGGTALHIAVTNGYLLIVSALVEAGADIHIKDKKGFSALDRARDRGFPDILELLTNKAEEQRVVAARAEAEAEAIRAQALAELLADDDREKAAGGSKDKDKGKSNSKDKGKNKNKNKDSK